MSAEQMTETSPVPQPVAKLKKTAVRKATPAAPKPPTAVAHHVEPATPEAVGEFAGMTTTKCPDACMKDGVCIISTVNVCKHPCLCGDAGSGPKTMANRAKAMKFIKHQQVG